MLRIATDATHPSCRTLVNLHFLWVLNIYLQNEEEMVPDV